LRYISSTNHSFWPNGEGEVLTRLLASIPSAANVFAYARSFPAVARPIPP
jgi:hypothetical protein